MIADIISATGSLLKTVTDMYTNWHALNLDVEVKLRLAYLEAQRNLSLLRCLKLDDDTPQNTEAMKATILLLSGDVLDMIFTDGLKNDKLSKKLVSLVTPHESPDDSIVHVMDITVSISVMIHTLKSIASFPTPIDGLRDIRTKQRLLNLQEKCLALVELLAPEIGKG